MCGLKWTVLEWPDVLYYNQKKWEDRLGRRSFCIDKEDVMGYVKEESGCKQKNIRLILSKPLDRKVYEKLEGLPKSTQSAVIKMALAEYFDREEKRKVLEEMTTCVDSLRTLEEAMNFMVDKLVRTVRENGGMAYPHEEEYL